VDVIDQMPMIRKLDLKQLRGEKNRIAPPKVKYSTSGDRASPANRWRRTGERSRRRSKYGDCRRRILVFPLESGVLSAPVPRFRHAGSVRPAIVPFRSVCYGFYVMADFIGLTSGAASQTVEDIALVAALRTGDDQAYEQVVRTTGGRLMAVARRMLGDEQDAQDAVQETFLSAFRAIDRFDGKSQLNTWLHRVMVNVCLMKLRSRKRKPERSIDEMLPQFLDDGHLADPTEPWRDAADVAAQRSETREFVRNSIDRLPEAYRTVILLRDIEELDTEETAQLLGISIPVVKTRLHRARLALKTLLEPHFRRGHA
jgi:RNA polymerase sigma-70 factor (ECF subfamily)